ncbi:hypothetical protein H8S37_04080 [Mediterraneibacter sp. NSJ-55]|uniref:Uncharacterized protein n=1 Tax=Mediterraneibacter hominis TaxID=2763054 RepID=A0A923RR77_9FIRM|nr:hypothetical protein [Mediterraneibacter hominis]MBC5688112.1 hypothetical protein [Mediterraneibacter hominis]
MVDKFVLLDDVIKAIDKHTNEDGILDDDITCILESDVKPAMTFDVPGSDCNSCMKKRVCKYYDDSNIRKIIDNHNSIISIRCKEYCSDTDISDTKNYNNKRTCLTCKYGIPYPPPHTCDICTSLDNDEEYSMWEPK